MGYISFPFYVLRIHIHSRKLDRFYVGTTDNFDFRLREHNDALYKNAFTAKGIPWTEFMVIYNLESRQAYSIEKHIKRMKSKQYIHNLAQYPEMVSKLRELYKN